MSPKKRKVSKRLAAANKQNLQLRKDIIAECPYEILCNVLSQLDLKTLCRCLNVSVVWRNRISSVPSIWRTVKNPPQYFWRDKQASTVLPFVFEHVEEIFLQNRLRETAHFIEATRKYKFPKLKSLSLLVDVLGRTGTTHLSLRIYHTITRFNDTLKVLHITIKGSSPLSISAILSRCPNLTALKIRAWRITDSSKALTTPHFALISLEVSGPLFISKNLRGLVRSLPNLQHLMISSTSLITALQPVILQYCPRLSVVSSQSFAHQHARNAILRPSESNDENQGLQSISMEYLDAVEPLMPLLQRASSTVKHIYMSTSNNVLLEPGWHLLSTIEMPQLTALHIVDYSDSFIRRITSVIRRLPSLRTVNLEHPFSCRNEEWVLRENEGLFSALLELNHLSSLSLTRIDIRGQAFVRLMRNRATSNNLALLSIVGCKNLSPTVLRLAASMQSLEVLNLSFCMDSIDQADMDEFAEMVGRLPRLRKLTLFRGKISDEAAVSISRSQSLRILYIDRMTEISRKARKAVKPIIELDTAMSYLEIRWVDYLDLLH